jgi:DNA-binding LacI/PurR family transcriptional regulator
VLPEPGIRAFTGKVVGESVSVAVTLAEIATRVGVHVSLVSRVLRNDSSAKVSPAKRAQIVAIAKETGYRPNRLGRSLRTGKAQIIGVIAPDITNPFYSVMFRGVESVAAAAGYDTILVNTNNSSDRVKEVVAMLAEGHVDGVLIATAKAVDASLDWLTKEEVPYVLINRRRIGGEDPWVGPDDFQTGYLGASHLLDLGHRRIAFLVLDVEIGNIQSRLAGIKAAIEERGVDPSECFIRTDLKERNAGKQYVRDLLALPQDRRPTAFFVPQTVLSEAMVHAVYQSGLQVPQQVSVVGYTARDDPEFTSVKVPLDEIGRAATEHLIGVISGARRASPPPSTTMPVTLIDMGSTAPPPV